MPGAGTRDAEASVLARELSLLEATDEIIWLGGWCDARELCCAADAGLIDRKAGVGEASVFVDDVDSGQSGDDRDIVVLWYGCLARY